jgi:hypothetical protein
MLEGAMAAGIIRNIDPALFIHDLHVQLIGYFCHRPMIERLKPGDPFSIEALIGRREHLASQIFRQLTLDGGEDLHLPVPYASQPTQEDTP